MSKIGLFKTAIYPLPVIISDSKSSIDGLWAKIKNTPDYKRLIQHPNKYKFNQLDMLVNRTLFFAVILADSLILLRRDYVEWKAAGSKDLDKQRLMEIDLNKLNSLSKAGGLFGVGMEKPEISDIASEVASRISYWKDYRYIHELLSQFYRDTFGGTMS